MCRSMMCFLSSLSARLQAIIHIILLLIYQGSVYRSVDRRHNGVNHYQRVGSTVPAEVRFAGVSVRRVEDVGS
jgi:hypothetical protein